MTSSPRAIAPNHPYGLMASANTDQPGIFRRGFGICGLSALFVTPRPGREAFMLLSIALILIFGLALGELAGLLRLPKLTGMIAAGILLGSLG